MIGHLNGKEHQKQLRRLKDDEMRNKTGKSLNDNLVPSYADYKENFWNENKGPRKLRPEQERFLDTERLDDVPAKLDRERYDNGQYKFNKKEMYAKTATCGSGPGTRCRPTRREPTTRRRARRSRGFIVISA